jgi:uncharacterized protein
MTLSIRQAQTNFYEQLSDWGDATEKPPLSWFANAPDPTARSENFEDFHRQAFLDLLKDEALGKRVITLNS